MKKSKLSKTPRKTEHSRKIPFSLAMREGISKNWVAVRKNAYGKSKKTRRGKK